MTPTELLIADFPYITTDMTLQPTSDIAQETKIREGGDRDDYRLSIA